MRELADFCNYSNILQMTIKLGGYQVDDLSVMGTVN